MKLLLTNPWLVNDNVLVQETIRHAIGRIIKPSNLFNYSRGVALLRRTRNRLSKGFVQVLG
jgi:hypothetical protein